MHLATLLLAIVMTLRTLDNSLLGEATLAAALIILAMGACTDKAPPSQATEAPNKLDLPKAAPSAEAGKHEPLPLLRHCTKLSAPPTSRIPEEAWAFRHLRSKAIAKLGRAAHSAQDVFAKNGEEIVIPGKFSYGRVSKDLEDETVSVFMDSCLDTWTSLGESVTDDDGRSALKIASANNPGVGIYNIRQIMQGDLSSINSRLTVAPSGSRIVIFDVDGTLTIGDDELANEMKAVYFDELVSGKRTPKPYPDAAALTKAWQAKGYLVVYITGRPYWLAGLTRDWLNEQGCAEGHLHTTDRNRDARPTEGGVGEFKAAYLKELIKQGYSIDYVYGNAESDVFAYAEAGIAQDKTHIIGEFGGKGGTVALKDGYTEHISWVSEQPDAKQPFAVNIP